MNNYAKQEDKQQHVRATSRLRRCRSLFFKLLIVWTLPTSAVFLGGVPLFAEAITGALHQGDVKEKIKGEVKREFNLSSTVNRVGGNYLVREIKRTEKGTLLITFESVVKNGTADIIKLDSDHIHVGVQEGQTLRLSAEVEKTVGRVVEASQILLFLPRPNGAVPVWLLSKKGRKGSLRGSSYLKMHNPNSDYVVM